MNAASNDNRSKGGLADDLESDPGIGKSKGAFATGKDPEKIKGDSTVEGDVQQDSSVGGGADPDQLGRTNE